MKLTNDGTYQPLDRYPDLWLFKEHSNYL